MINYLKKTVIKISKNQTDPDKRDYFVSNKKIEKKGFKATIPLEKGIKELSFIFANNKKKIINNSQVQKALNWIRTKKSVKPFNFPKC